MNIRHNINPAVVEAEITRKVLKYESLLELRKADAEQLLAQYQADLIAGRHHSRWSRRPDDPETVVTTYNGAIEHERAYYSTVRVIELPYGDKRFLLVYGDINDQEVGLGSGTGPFSSLEDAQGWFIRGGR